MLNKIIMMSMNSSLLPPTDIESYTQNKMDSIFDSIMNVMMLVIPIAMLVLTVLVVIIIAAAKKKKKQNNENNSNI